MGERAGEHNADRSSHNATCQPDDGVREELTASVLTLEAFDVWRVKKKK